MRVLLGERVASSILQTFDSPPSGLLVLIHIQNYCLATYPLYGDPVPPSTFHCFSMHCRYSAFVSPTACGRWWLTRAHCSSSSSLIGSGLIEPLPLALALMGSSSHLSPVKYVVGFGTYPACQLLHLDGLVLVSSMRTSANGSSLRRIQIAFAFFFSTFFG